MCVGCLAESVLHVLDETTDTCRFRPIRGAACPFPGTASGASHVIPTSQIQFSPEDIKIFYSRKT